MSNIRIKNDLFLINPAGEKNRTSINTISKQLEKFAKLSESQV